MVKYGYIAITAALLVLGACGRVARHTLSDELAAAEHMLTSNPDSALTILGNVDTGACGKRDYAAWCLLKTWAQYNAYATDIPAEQLETGTSYFLKRNDRKMKALAYYLKAVVQEESGAISQAGMVDCLKRGCKEIEGTDEHYLASLLYMRYGCEMSRRHWYSNAAEALDKALEEAEKGNLYILQVTILINLSHTYMFMADDSKDYSDAIRYAERASETAEKHELELNYARAQSALSSCFSRAGKFREALDCALRANKIEEHLAAAGKSHRQVSHLALADAYRKLENPDSAIFYASKDLDADNIVTRASARQLMYIVYRDILNDNGNAVKYLTEYNALKSKMTEEQENEKVLRNEVELEQDIAESRRNTTLWAAAGAIALILALTGILILVHRRRIKVKDSTIMRQSREIEEKVLELDVKANELVEKSQELEIRKDEVKQKDEELHKAIVEKSGLIQQLRRQPHYLKDEEADELVHIVDKAFGGYCTSLSTSEQKLTRANIRLAALVKLGFTTGQIAAMEGISPTSVTKAKQRLKARLRDNVHTSTL